MAYKGYKGCGPRGLGSSPIKQKSTFPDGKQKVNIEDFAVRQTPQTPNRAGMIKNQPGFYNNEFTQPKPQIGNLNSVIDLSDMVTGGPIGGLVKKAGIGFIAKSGLGKFIMRRMSSAKKLLPKSTKSTKAHKEAWKRFEQNAQRNADGTPDWTKTSHSGYTKKTGPKPPDESSFLRAEGIDARDRKFYGQTPGSN